MTRREIICHDHIAAYNHVSSEITRDPYKNHDPIFPIYYITVKKIYNKLMSPSSCVYSAQSYFSIFNEL